MAFIAPWFLALLPLAAAPVVFHLFFKVRKKPLPFSSLMFFLRIEPNLQAKRKLREILLLALRVDDFRAPLLSALHVTFRAPDQVALYLFSPNGWVVENFNNEPVTVVLNGESLKIGGRGWLCHWN